MMKMAFRITFSYFVEIIHIQLNNNLIYLPNERRVIGMFKVDWQNLFRKFLLFDNNKSNTIMGPLNCIMIVRILN